MKRSHLRVGGVGQSPVSRKGRRSQELLVGVLLVNVHGLKVRLNKSLAQKRCASDELRFGKVGVVDESVILR